MSNNVQIPTTLGSPTTTIETIDEGGGVERQVIVLGSIGDASGETQLSGGQQTSGNSIPVVVASDQSAIQVDTEGQKQTYSGSGGATNPFTGTGVFGIITGSTTKTIRITYISVSFYSSVAQTLNLSVSRLSAYTGSAASTATNAKHDINNSTGTATFSTFTTAPTITSAGSFRTIDIDIPANTSFTATWDFGTRNGQAIVLRGTSDYLAVSFGDGGLQAGTNLFNWCAEWTEE
jgi:hypothetical protein